MLTERQQTAEALAREIHKLGGFVTSVLPLDARSHLRFQVVDGSQRDGMLQTLSSWNWSPVLVSATARVTHRGFEPASVYELRLEPDRQAIPDATHSGERGGNKLPPGVEAMLKHLGMR